MRTILDHFSSMRTPSAARGGGGSTSPLRFPTTPGADEILTVESLPSITAAPRGRRSRNPVASDSGEVSYGRSSGTKKKHGAWHVDASESMKLYDGHEGLLVRTALIRSPMHGAEAKKRVVIRSAEDAAYLVKHLQVLDQEHMVIIAVSNTNYVTAIYEAAIGTATSAMFNARDMLKVLVLTGSPAAILVHNHPSGNHTPSADDMRSTKAVKDSLACVGMSLLDHLVISASGYTSFHQEGLL